VTALWRTLSVWDPTSRTALRGPLVPGGSPYPPTARVFALVCATEPTNSAAAAANASITSPMRVWDHRSATVDCSATDAPGFRATAKWALPAVAVVAVAGAFRLLYGAGTLGYDGFYALVWGRELLHGQAPSYDAPTAPTPHPLATLFGTVLAPLGDAAPDVWQVASAVAFGAAVWALWRLGSALFSVAVGVLAGALFATRPFVVAAGLSGSIDLAFLALVLTGAKLAVARRDVAALVALTVAGLLRPEAWLLALAYAAWLAPRSDRKHAFGCVALALAAPALWTLGDLLATGDPFFSLTSTTGLARELGRPRSLGAALERLPVYLRDDLGRPLLWAGLAGLAFAAVALYRRAVVPLVLTLAGLLGFVALGLARLPLLTRYTLLPAAMLVLFVAVLAFGGRQLPPGRLRTASQVIGAAVVAIAVGLSLAPTVRRLDDTRDFFARQHALDGELHDLASQRAVRVASRHSHSVFASDPFIAPRLAWWLDRSVRTVRPVPPLTPPVLAVVPASGARNASLSLDPTRPTARVLGRRRVRRVAGNRAWVAGLAGAPASASPVPQETAP
jgi:hypothetical protein